MTDIITDIADVGKVIDIVAKELGQILSTITTDGATDFWQLVSGNGGTSKSYVEHQLSNEINNFDKDLGRLIVQPLLEGTMGVDYQQLTVDSGNAVNTLEGAVGFSLLLDAVTEGLDAILKPILGDRAPEFILDTIRKIPQAVGMEYFLGITLANTFELAVGTPLEEAINQQVLPARIDIQILRQLWRQHKISDTDADSYRAKLGYRPEDWALIQQLGENLLSVSEIQQLYEYGKWSENDVINYLQSLGYSSTDIDDLTFLYLQKSETTGGNLYRQVARTAYMENAISSAQFTSILQDANVPEASITLELQALDLQKSIGTKLLSVGDLKAAFINGDLSATEIQARLADDGYNANDIALIMQTWSSSQYAIKPTTTAKTILRFYRSGVIDEGKAQQALANLGIAPEVYNAMITNPEGLGSGYVHELTPATVIAAYKDQVITVDDARDKLESLGVSPTQTTIMLQNAQYQMANKRVPKGATKVLSVSDIKDAYKYGTATITWVIRELQNAGYSADDAQLIAATEVADLSGQLPPGWTPLT